MQCAETTEYLSGVPPVDEAGVVLDLAGARVEFIPESDFWPEHQCEHCGEVDALVEARVYGPGDEYAEVCVRDGRGCAVGLVDLYRREGDGNVRVEIAGQVTR